MNSVVALSAEFLSLVLLNDFDFTWLQPPLTLIQEVYHSQTSEYQTSVFRTSGCMLLFHTTYLYLLFYYSVQIFTLKKWHLLGLIILLSPSITE